MKKHLKYWWILLIVFILVGIGRMIYLPQNGYVWADWDDLRDKSIWMILELVLVPITLAIFIYFLDRFERQAERDLNLDNQRERLLQNFFDSMTDLILSENLKGSKEDDEVREIARIKTLTTLKRLDCDRRSSLLEFLYETELIQERNNTKIIIGLNDANLEGINLYSADLYGANLKNSHLKGAQLEMAVLTGANLENSHLEGANLKHAYMDNVLLDNAHLENANLEKAHLKGAFICTAHLENSCMIDAHLDGAHLDNAHLECAILKSADLKDTHLEGAHLEGAVLDKANLIGAYLDFSYLDGTKFDNATMPDGKKYNPENHTIEYLTGKKAEE